MDSRVLPSEVNSCKLARLGILRSIYDLYIAVQAADSGDLPDGLKCLD